MLNPSDIAEKRGAEDSGRYFKYMADFVGLTESDIETIKQSKPIIEKHIPEIVTKFYAHLLRYPPTRRVFLKKDGSVDQPYVELRMRHLTNFWLRTATGVYDDDYARYIDYVGRAHTSHGADPHIYIAERYVIGQVGFVQHAITDALSRELRHTDEEFEVRAVEAWDKLMMVLLEMLSRAYGNEREAESFDALVPVDQDAVARLADTAFQTEEGKATALPLKEINVARVEEIPEGDRKIIHVGDLSIGVFHHNGKWYALHNLCLHRGGPVATGTLEGDTLTCPWHGFEYNVTNGELLVDPNAKLEMYPVVVQDGQVRVQVPDVTAAPAAKVEQNLKENEFRTVELTPGQTRSVRLGDENVAVYNVDGVFYATQEECTHAGGPLSEGDLDGRLITCPLHGSRFDVSNGTLVRGPAKRPLKTYRVVVDGPVARVEKNS